MKTRWIVDRWLTRYFRFHGRLVARYPLIVVGICVVITFCLSIGWKNFAVETDPIKLWVDTND